MSESCPTCGNPLNAGGPYYCHFTGKAFPDDADALFLEHGSQALKDRILARRPDLAIQREREGIPFKDDVD